MTETYCPYCGSTDIQPPRLARKHYHPAQCNQCRMVWIIDYSRKMKAAPKGRKTPNQNRR